MYVSFYDVKKKFCFTLKLICKSLKQFYHHQKKNDLSGRLKSDCLIFSGNNSGTFFYSFI